MVKTTVGQITVLGGRLYEGAINALVDERTARSAQGRDRGSLYILVEMPGRTQTGDPRQVAEIIDRAYYGHRGSVTAGLQQAVREANHALFEENRNSLPGEQRTAGVSCAVLRGDDLFIAQAGPAAAYVAQGDEVTRFPDVSPWLDDISPGEVDAARLGDRSDTPVTLFHIQVSSGDALLLVETDVARSLPLQTWTSILADQSMLDRLQAEAQGMDLSAVAVTMDGGDVKAGAAPVPGVGATQQIARWTGQLRLKDRLQAVGRSLVAALAGLWAGLLAFFRRMIPSEQPASANRPRSAGPSRSRPEAGRGSTRPAPKGQAAGRAGRQRPPTRSTPRAGAGGDLTRKLLIGVAVAIPLIVAVIVGLTLLQRGQTRRSEAEALWQQAGASVAQAATVADPVAKRTALTTAQSALDRLIELQPKRADAVDLRDQVVKQLDEINQVKRIGWAGALNTYPADADLSRVVVQGMYIFVMDRRAGKVYQHRLDQSQQALEAGSLAKALVSRGDQVGGTVVGDLVDMVWMGVDLGNVRQRPALVILESGGALIEYDPTTGELNALPVAASDTWQYPELVGSHTGRFYLLDTTASKIWRYSPTAEGYAEAPADWLQTGVDLTGVVDMSVGDGIYLLYADGRIVKLEGGQPADFSVANWDTPPRSPTAFSTYPPDETEWVYVADAGNSRLVQTTPEGAFTRQFRLADTEVADEGDVLKGVTSLFVDESVKRAYLLSGNKLYLVILPE